MPKALLVLNGMPFKMYEALFPNIDMKNLPKYAHERWPWHIIIIAIIIIVIARIKKLSH